VSPSRQATPFLMQAVTATRKLQRLPGDVELLAFEAGCEDYGLTSLEFLLLSAPRLLAEGVDSEPVYN
jgi:hypothetical protein